MPTISFVQLIESLLNHVKVDGPLWLLVTAICYLFALIFGYVSLMQLKAVGDGQSHSYRPALMSFVAAAMMAGSPELLKTLLVSVYGDIGGASPLSYVKNETGDNKTIFALMSMVSFIGYVFFVRGIVILKNSGEPQRHPQDTVPKALAVLLAGMAAIYIDVTLKMLGNTFGFNLSTYLN